MKITIEKNINAPVANVWRAFNCYWTFSKNGGNSKTAYEAFNTESQFLIVVVETPMLLLNETRLTTWPIRPASRIKNF